MPKLKVYNAQGKSNEEIDVSDAVFGVPVNQTLVHQVYVALQANAREPWADTKSKGEVRGGGKKPWRQKGTGRARHGSIRSPLWRGGGVIFGPRTLRNYEQKVNKKMNRQAVRMCLSGKVQDEAFVVVDIMPTTGKTRDFATMRNVLPGAGHSTLVITNAADTIVGLSVRNVADVLLRSANDVNVVDLLHHKYVIATKEALTVLQKRLAS